MALTVLRIAPKLLSTYLLPTDNMSQPIRGQKGNLGWWEGPCGTAVDTLVCSSLSSVPLWTSTVVVFGEHRSFDWQKSFCLLSISAVVETNKTRDA